MVEGADLYSILVSYAKKINSPFIDISFFLEYLGRSAKMYAKDSTSWKKWAQEDRKVKFWSELSAITEDGKCELLGDTIDGRIFMSFYYPDLLTEVYKHIDEKPDLPFPSEESLKITIPGNQVRYLNSDYDLIPILADPQKAGAPILKLGFPDSFGFALVLPGMIPRQLTEIALRKIREYLHHHGNREFAYHKLSSTLQGKEAFVKDQLDQILMRPAELYRLMEESSELTSAFWAHFCNLVKNDIKKKKERLFSEIAVFQSLHIIEAVNGFYRSLALRKKEVELAFRNLEASLAKPPYLYTMEQILKFTSPAGGFLKDQYTTEELEAWIRKQTTDAKDNKLPALLVLKTSQAIDQGFILKTKILFLCARLLNDARFVIKNDVSKHWGKLVHDYQSEPAMENDIDFEKLLVKTAEKHCPELMSLLADSKLAAVYYEMEHKENGIPANLRIFSSGKLLPYSALFLLWRKELLSDAKSDLPFWYSLPIISSIIGFFKRLSQKKKPAKQSLHEEEIDEQETLEEKSHVAAIKDMAEELELELVPAGYTLDLYLKALEDRWIRLIDMEARESLINDLKYLARENLRRTIKINKQFKLTMEALNQLAYNFVIRHPVLSTITARDSLINYIELYFVKLLVSIK